jgi:hypothetical protein
MRRNVVLLSVCLAMACFMAFSVQLVQAAGDVQIVSHSSFYTSTNLLYVVGEVENTGDTSTEFTKVTATFYDSEDQIVATKIGYATLDILPPGRKSPFYIMLLEDDGALDVDDYSLTASWSEADEEKEHGLEILSSSTDTDALDFLHVTGEIKNTGSATANEVMVSATFYDSEGTVVGRSWEYAEPEDLSPDQTGTFDVDLIYSEQIAKVASYSLTAESLEYALVPEFPTWASLVAAVAVVALTAIVYKKRLQTKK